MQSPPSQPGDPNQEPLCCVMTVGPWYYLYANDYIIVPPLIYFLGSQNRASTSVRIG